MLKVTEKCEFAGLLKSAQETHIMRIAMLGWEFPPMISGGLGVHCYELSKRLGQLGISIDFYMPKRKSSMVHPKLKNVRIIEVAATSHSSYQHFRSSDAIGDENYGLDFMREVSRYSAETADLMSRAGKYDLVHFHDWMTVRAAKALGKTPRVFTVHSTEYDRAPHPWQEIVNIELEGAMIADRVIAVSGATKERLVGMGAPAEKIRVVYNGVDSDKFDQSAKNVSKRERTVLLLGRLSEQKGVAQFIRAARRVLDEVSGVRFVIAGTGPLLPHLINTAIELGIIERVSFLGHISEAEKKRLYAASDVFVMPSVSEPFGITALEAMASGTPCIISKTSGVSEIAGNCLKVDFWDVDGMAEKIVACLKYKPLARTLSEKGRDEARLFGWDKTAKETLKVYEEAVKK